MDNNDPERMGWKTVLALHLLVFGMCFLGAKLLLGR